MTDYIAGINLNLEMSDIRHFEYAYLIGRFQDQCHNPCDRIRLSIDYLITSTQVSTLMSDHNSIH